MIDKSVSELGFLQRTDIGGANRWLVGCGQQIRHHHKRKATEVDSLEVCTFRKHVRGTSDVAEMTLVLHIVDCHPDVAIPQVIVWEQDHES